MSKLSKQNYFIKDLSYADKIDDSDWSGLIEEEKVIYQQEYQEKDIVFVKKYQYPTGEVGTNHLFVIMEKGYGVPIEYFCYLISSKISKVSFQKNYYLKKDHHNHLNKDSIVKTDVIYEIQPEDIICKIGTISNKQYQKYKKEFLKMYA